MGSPFVSSDEPGRNSAGLAQQETFAGTQGRKKSLPSLEKGTGNRESIRILLNYAKRKPSWNSIWLLL